MDAKELMIGDCVSVYGQNNDITQKPHWYNRKITADWLVNMEKLDLLNEKLAKRGIFVGHPQIGDVEPIPLTEEILKANGINRELPYPCDHVKICHNESEWFVTSCECYGFDIKYLHELQHALRLCGLHELADNFKNK